MPLNLFKKKVIVNKNQSESFELVKGLISSLLVDDFMNVEITPDTQFEDIGFDSIIFINLLLSLEDIIHVDLEKIAEEIDPASLRKVSDVVLLVEKFKNQSTCVQ